MSPPLVGVRTVTGEEIGTTHPRTVRDAASAVNSDQLTDDARAHHHITGGPCLNLLGPHRPAARSIIGTDWSARAQYNFDTANGFSQTAVGLGKGHYQGYNGSTFGVWTTYYGVGSADDGGGGASVPWGEVADNEGFKAECATTTICWGDFWDF
jgi:hypothetical protein